MFSGVLVISVLCLSEDLSSEVFKLKVGRKEDDELGPQPVALVLLKKTKLFTL